MAPNDGGKMNLLELQNIIDFAIEKEQEAVDFYNDLAGKVELKALAEELHRIAAIEEGHRERLRKMDVIAAARSIPSQVMDLHIAEYVVEKKATPDMSWQDILSIAMHRELASINLYTDLEKLVTDPLAKQLFQNLASEERDHKLFFEKIWDDEVLSSSWQRRNQ